MPLIQKSSEEYQKQKNPNAQNVRNQPENSTKKSEGTEDKSLATKLDFKYAHAQIAREKIMYSLCYKRLSEFTGYYCSLKRFYEYEQSSKSG